MTKKRILHPSINKWVLFTSAGMIAASGYGIFEWCQQQPHESTSWPSLPLLNEANKIVEEADDIPEAVEEEATTTVSVTEETSNSASTTETVTETVPTPEDHTSASPQPIVVKEEDKYPIDQNYLKNANSWSIAVKYKDYMVLSPKGSPIWNEKAKKLQDRTKQRADKTVFTYWYGYWGKDQITAESTHKLCSQASLYSENGTTWTLLFPGKSYFDFLWDICGREDKTKPDSWWYR